MRSVKIYILQQDTKIDGYPADRKSGNISIQNIPVPSFQTGYFLQETSTVNKNNNLFFGSILLEK